MSKTIDEIKHIVFDVGRVLIHWDPEIPFLHLIPNEMERQHFLSSICAPEWNIEQDRGRSWREAEDILIKQYPDKELQIRGYRKHWIEMIYGALDDSVVIMQRLIDQGMDVTLLTNFNQETFPLAKEKFPFLKLPRGETVSGEIGLIKPDLEIYQHHTNTHGLDPHACLFFDDSQKNVDGARAAGWQAELFTSPAQMHADLEKHGVAQVAR